MKKGLPYILLTGLLFTTLEPVSKLIAGQVDPFAITFIRFFIGGLILLTFSIAKVRQAKITLGKKDYAVMSLLGIFCICVSMPLLQYAVMKAENPAIIAIIFSSNAVFTIAFSALILKDKITPVKLAAIVLCIAGVLVSADFSKGSDFLSVTLAVAAALTFSLYTVLSKKYMKKLVGIVQTGYSFLIGSLVLLVILLAAGIDAVGPVNAGNIGSLLFLGVAVTGIGYWSYFKAMHHASAMAASFVFFIKPILTPFAAFLINGITPGANVFAALALVLVGSYLAVGHVRLPKRAK